MSLGVLIVAIGLRKLVKCCWQRHILCPQRWTPVATSSTHTGDDVERDDDDVQYKNHGASATSSTVKIENNSDDEEEEEEDDNDDGDDDDKSVDDDKDHDDGGDDRGDFNLTQTPSQPQQALQQPGNLDDANPEHDCPSGWRYLPQLFTDWDVVFSLGFPGALSLLVEWGSFELATAIAGR